MTTPELNNESFDDDFDLRKFIGIIWGGKALILSVSFIFSFVAVMSSMQLEDYYSSEALLVPSSEESNSSGMAGVSGLASLAGIGIGAGSTSKTKEAIAVLKSRKFIVDFIQKYNLMIPILAAKSWDSVNNELKIDPSIFDIESSKWVERPNLSQAYRKFITEHYFVSSDILGSGLVTIRVEFISPYLTKEWVDLLIKEINENFKDKEINEANRSLEYINGEVLKANLNLDLKKALYELIKDHTGTLVLANGKDEFMFNTIDPAYVADLKTGPVRSIYVLLAFFVGASLSILLLFIAYYNNQSIKLISKFPWINSSKI